MKRELLTLFLIAIVNNCFGQQFTDLYGDFLAQKPPGDTAVVYAPGIVSTKNLEHSSVSFSKDGNIIIWCTIQDHIKKIIQMERINNRWTQPAALDFFGDNCKVGNDSPFITSDGKKIYFSSERENVKNPSNIESEWIKNTNTDLWYVEKYEIGWSKPVRIDSIINTGISQFHISVSSSGNIYYVSYLPGALNDCGIYSSQFKENTYHQPKALPLPIDKSFQNWTPFISPDESYLIYSKCINRGDYGDLYITYHDKDKGKWSVPRNMGKSINTRAQERFPYVSPDGKYLFFTRWTKENNHDVFWVKSDIIRKLKRYARFE